MNQGRSRSSVDKIDTIDAQILDLLQRQGRIKRTAIAEAVGLSIPSVSERMRKLEERGVIQGYGAVLDAKRLHVDIAAFVRVLSTSSEHYDTFVSAVTGMHEVQELHSITGEGSHILKIRVRNTAALEGLLARLQALPGVRGTQTSIVLSSLKETSYLPAEPMTLLPSEPALNGNGADH
ncbi:MAG: Lrp/AsnC family transcriptional regulator [Rhodothermaceae bacterium]|nr:Lrp/AsnC family transcriptional regulator [Rhodothermaceae bacterium]